MNRKQLMTSLVVTAMWLLTAVSMQAQTQIYPHHFRLDEVTLTDGPFKTAMNKNFELLLQYDVDRLLNPFIRQSGLNNVSGSKYYGWQNAHPSFPNWGSGDFNLDGHVGGHYLSAVSLAYAACHDATKKIQLKAKVDYMVEVMKDCQDAYNNNTEGLYGFIGGQPMNDAWKRLYANGDRSLSAYGCAVPWYCQHKIMAGLRDAYIYGENTAALSVFLKLCDWTINVTSRLSDQEMQYMLDTEHGGVNESLLDAYQLSGQTKYLTAAKRFTHQTMLNGMQSLNTTFLDNRHANTQVPKYVGMARIGEQDGSATAYTTAAKNFWTDVATNRTVCIGGNSMYEHFISANAGNVYIDNVDGPESCNTNNMLKLSEILSDGTHDAKYADFYEYATWNHILSTQDPTTGGYVYFTTLRPQGYRIYSTVNESMWCCVGTGMENHSKYGHFIYTHDGNTKLYVNLFTPSRLESSDFVLTQETSFPFEAQTRLTVGKAGSYTIAIRHPWWTTSDYKVKVNGTEQSISVTKGIASYVSINRTWSVGDVITVDLPMELRYTQCPNYYDYISFQYGPILLAAQTTAKSQAEATETGLAYEALQNEYGHEGRMDHAPGSRGTSKTLTSAPLLIGERNLVLNKITPTDLSQLKFTIDASRPGVESYTWNTLTLQPFYQIHHARYSCYWYQQTEENYMNSSMAEDERIAAALISRTLDFVATGEQQSEAGHITVYENSTTGVYNDEYFRDARPDNGFVQYTLSYEGTPIESGMSVLCRFTTADSGRKGTLYVDGVNIANITALADFKGANSAGFYNVEFPIPASLMRDEHGNIKQSFVVKLAADKGTNAPGLYYLRLMKEYDNGLSATITTSDGSTRTVVDGVITGDNGQSDMSHCMFFNANVTNENHGTYQNRFWRNGRGGQYYGYELWTNGVTDGASLVVEYNMADGDRVADISIDGVKLLTEKINGFFSNFASVEYPIDAKLLEGKDRITVQFTSVNNSYTPGTYHVYLTSGRNAVTRTLTPYVFVPSNFEKNGNDGNISSFTTTDDAIQIASGGGNYQINMRMKTSVKNTYSILPNQYLFVVKGQTLSNNAYLWWLLGCNHGAQDAPTYTKTDGSDVYLIWDLRKIATFNEAEKKARFFGTAEVPVTTNNGGAYSLMCMGLTSSSGGNATLTDIGFYSPEELVDKYDVLKSSIPSLATELTTGDSFVFGDFLYNVISTTTAEASEMLSTGTSFSDAPATVFGYTVSTEGQATELNKQIILSNGGDATSLLQNPDCNAAEGWTGSGTVALWGGQNWRGTSDDNDKYLDVGGLSWVEQSLTHMPAGYYKLVAALRAYDGGKITPRLNDATGATHNGMTYGASNISMINIQGVQMPADAVFHGYGVENTRGWQWGTATLHLENDGNLTVRFDLADGWWKCVDDVHLYYSETPDGFCTLTDTQNAVDDTKVLTCDIIFSNPNTLVTSDAAVTTASGDVLNNNLVSGTVANLVLFDGYAYQPPTTVYAATTATLYRTLPQGQWCTLLLPFALATEMTMKVPTALDSEGVLYFDDATPASDAPMLVKSTTVVEALTGTRASATTSSLSAGAGAPMYGTYTLINELPYDTYVVGRKAGETEDKLFKVNSKVGLYPFRAYFAVDEGSEVKPSVISFDFEGTPTAIGQLTGEHADEPVYTLQGTRVKHPVKGIYVRGGKKVLVK